MTSQHDVPAPEITRLTRRGALGVSLAAGGLALTACGSSTSSGGAGGGSGSAGSSGAGGSGSAGIQVAETDVPVGGGVVRDGVVVTQPTEGDFHAFDARCPHQGCLVTRIDAKEILCPCHGSTFDPTTGDRTAGPAEQGLAAKKVTLDAGTLSIT